MIKLKTIQRPNPKDQSTERKYYVSAKNSGEISLEEMSENISDRCTLTETDVLAALSALQREMIKNMMAGKIVRFGTFGSFQLSLNSSGVEKSPMLFNDKSKEYVSVSDREHAFRKIFAT